MWELCLGSLGIRVGRFMAKMRSTCETTRGLTSIGATAILGLRVVGLEITAWEVEGAGIGIIFNISG